MSDFFSDLGDAARRVVSDVSTGVNVAALEQKIRDAQRILGQLYFKAVCEGEEPQGPEFDEQVETIRQLKRQIHQKRKSHDVK